MLAFIENHGAGTLLDLAAREERRARTHLTVGLPLVFLAVAVGAIAADLVGISSRATPLHVVVLSAPAALALSIFLMSARRSRRRGLLRAIALCDDQRTIGLFAEALRISDGVDMRGAARGELIRRLPLAEAGESPQINRIQRDALYSSLRSAFQRPDPEFVLAAITGLARLGDTVGLATVRRMAALALRYSRRPDARALAAKVTELLPELEQTAAAAHAHQQLLRASGELAGATLPRAASPAAHSELPRQADQPAAAAEPGSAPAEAALRAQP